MHTFADRPPPRAHAPTHPQVPGRDVEFVCVTQSVVVLDGKHAQNLDAHRDEPGPGQDLPVHSHAGTSPQNESLHGVHPQFNPPLPLTMPPLPQPWAST